MLQGYVHPDFGKVADMLSRQIPRNCPGGAALTVYHKGQCVVDIWGGTRNRDSDAWRSDTLALSFSTTKGVASTLLHILVDQGRPRQPTLAGIWPALQTGHHRPPTAVSRSRALPHSPHDR